MRFLVSISDLPYQVRPGPDPEPGNLLSSLSLEGEKDGIVSCILVGSKDEVHQAQQSTCIPLIEQKKDANIQVGDSIASSLYNHTRDGTMYLLW